MRRIFLRASIAVSLVAVALGAGYFIYLYHTITDTFEERRWTKSSVVYALPLELYPGRALSQRDLEIELERLSYRRDSNEPGTFNIANAAIDTVLRPFQFADSSRPATPLRIAFDGPRIKHIRAPDGAAISLVQLEPPVIGSVFPSHGEDRLIVSPQETPQLLTDALKVVEDRRFDQHRGYDLRGIARAFWVNLRAGGFRQGGSTLTQQLVKSYFLDNRRTLRRKLQELAMAVILDARFDKVDLLNAYVNEIYLGQDGSRAVHGFGLGAQFYFNKPLSELEPHEIALLVAVIRGPSYYNPFRHTERAKQRRDLVLKLMTQFDLIDARTYARGIAAPLGVSGATRRGGSYYPAFMDLVRRQLNDDYDDNDLATSGYRVFTTLDPRTQEAAERAATNTLTRLEIDRELPPGELQVAVFVTHTQTGEAVAVVGGREAGFQGLNRVLAARRPVGSLIKPIVYLTALESGDYSLASIVDDIPLPPDPDNKRAWAPSNFDGKTHGPVPLVRALGDSLNLATVHLGLAVGVEHIAKRLSELAGIDTPPPYPSLLLGAVELTPYEMARLYGVFASGGFAAPTKAVLTVLAEDGAPLSRYPIAVEARVAAEANTQLVEALKVVMQKGTGKTSRWAARGAAGKTGTSNDFRDSWFAAFDGAHLTVVWVGYDDNRPTGLTGSAGAMRVWDALAEHLVGAPLEPNISKDLRLVDVDYATGLKANARCGDPVTVPLPRTERIGLKPGCPRDLGERLREWLGGR